jgi:hypothetical protein
MDVEGHGAEAASAACDCERWWTSAALTEIAKSAINQQAEAA